MQSMDNRSVSGSVSGSSQTLSRCGSSRCKTDQLLLRQRQAVAMVTADSAGSGLTLRCLWAGWLLMCWAGGMMSAAGFLLPHWLKGSRSGSDIGEQMSDLGLFRLCAYPKQEVTGGEVTLVLDCGHYKRFAEIPNAVWRAAFALMTTACCLLLLLTFFLAFTGFRVDILRSRAVTSVCGVTQGASAVSVLVSCLLYPAGWAANPDVQQVCGIEAAAFNLGRCHIGWAFVLTCAGGFLACVTVAFPVQICRNFADDKHQRQHEEEPGVAYKYVVYHSLQHQHQHQHHPACTCDCRSESATLRERLAEE